MCPEMKIWKASTGAILLRPICSVILPDGGPFLWEWYRKESRPVYQAIVEKSKWFG